MPQLLGDLSPYRRKGDKVSLTCLASGGNPLPELTWMRNGLPLRDSGKTILIVIYNCYFSKVDLSRLSIVNSNFFIRYVHVIEQECVFEKLDQQSVRQD